MFIQTEATPNPATLKFLPGQTVLGQGAMEFRSPEAAAKAPLAQALLSIEGVEAVMYGARLRLGDQEGRRMGASQARHPRARSWSISPPARRCSPRARAEVTDHGGEFYDPADAETVSTIKELIETRVRPAVAGDGGDIVFRGFRDGDRLSRHEGRLLRLPLLHRDAAQWHREPAAPFRAAGESRRTGFDVINPRPEEARRAVSKDRQ